MKTTIRFIIAALAATAALAGCTKEITPGKIGPDSASWAAEGSRVITVAFAPQTRTTLEGFQPKFAEKDSILISNGTALDTCEVNVESNPATISTDLDGPLTAVYPYEAAKMSGNDIDSVLVSTEQSGAFADANICMARMADVNDESLSFVNKTALFCIYPPTSNPGYVEISAESFDIANDVTAGSDYKSYSTIHVATTSADSVYVSILVPASLKIGDLKFSDGTNEKIITGDKAATEIAAGTLYIVDDKNWAAPEPEVEYVVMKMGSTGSNTLKWATKNLGAEKVATDYRCYGDYYQWGSVEKLYTSITWTGNTTGSFVGLKTDGFAETNLTYKDNADLSDATNDVVKKTYPGTGWRMPTNDDFQNLYDACVDGTYNRKKYKTDACGESTTIDQKGVYWCGNYDGVAGVLFYDGTSRLFFPAAGYGYGTSLNGAGDRGDYWSSSLYSSPSSAYDLGFNSGDVFLQDNILRYVGFSVRPVSD